jgi:hypothetical protein
MLMKSEKLSARMTPKLLRSVPQRNTEATAAPVSRSTSSDGRPRQSPWFV